MNLRLYDYLMQPFPHNHQHQMNKNDTWVSRNYQSGPRGGGTSRAVNPLMHCAAAPSPTLRMYCNHRSRQTHYAYYCMINVLFKDEVNHNLYPRKGWGTGCKKRIRFAIQHYVEERNECWKCRCKMHGYYGVQIYVWLCRSSRIM